MSERSVAEDIIQGLHEILLHKQGKITLREFTVEVPDEPRISPEEIVSLREQLGYSQPVFAAMLHIQPATLKNWEQGRSRPNTQAALLFRLIEKDPQTLRKISAL